MNFSWFASAYDTDDWLFRLLTMLQMVGVIILALGIPRMFLSVDRGGSFDNGVMVMGYVIMRLAMVMQWLRAASQDPPRRKACMVYVKTIIIAQLGWTAMVFVNLSPLYTVIAMILLTVVEFAGPALAQTKFGGTPWHAHHI